MSRNQGPHNGKVYRTDGLVEEWVNGVLITTSPRSKTTAPTVTPVTPTYTIPREPVKFDLKALERVCLMHLDDFLMYGDQYGKGDERYYYQDNGSPILAVAHLDSVATHKHFVRAKVVDEVIIYNAQLDDRLGAYIILELLPKLGMQCDILLTNGEETGHSTAKNFVPPHDRQYNWMFSFDRMGTDVVMYKYETPKYAQMLRESDFRVGTGSFSDIAVLDSLKCTGFNFGCGYADYHSKLAHVKLSDTEKMIQSFGHFYGEHKDEYLEYVPKVSSYSQPTRGGGYGTGGGRWEDDYSEEHRYWGNSGRVDDGKEFCSMHNGRVDEEDYVYSETCCYDCYKLALKDIARLLRESLAEAKIEEEFEITP